MLFEYNSSELSYDELNHPFFIYPRGFMSEYNDYSLYRKEVKKLYEFIKDLPNEISNNHSSKDTLIPFIIGSSMEDMLLKSHTSKENIFQYSQLFPNYINDFISHNENKKFIQIIIISPDNIFSNQEHKPYFTIFTKYDFINIKKNEYIYIDDFIEIKVNIFNCPVPCIESRNSLIIKYKNIFNNLNHNDFDITSYEQTNYDINFINYFYYYLNKLFGLVSKPNIKIIINSWVSFINLQGYSENYNMFPNILKLANKYNIIATEWNFIDDLFFTKIVSNYTFVNKSFNGSYINYYNSDSNTKYSFIKNKFVINFNCDYNLKKIG